MKNRKNNIGFKLSVIFILAVTAIAALAPLLAPNDPNAADMLLANAAPSPGYPLGNDQLGRCLLSRVLYGARISVFSSILITVIVFAIGTFIGVLSAYCGGWTDAVISKIITAVQAFPKVVLAIAIAGLLGIGIKNTIIALCAVGWVEFARMARSLTLTEKSMNYIKAARICGERHLKIICLRIIPNIIYPLIINASLGIASVIMEIAALSYLGVGVKDTVPEWGSMLNAGRNYMQTDIKLVLIPAAAIFIAAAVFNLFGEKLRERIK